MGLFVIFVFVLIIVNSLAKFALILDFVVKGVEEKFKFCVKEFSKDVFIFWFVCIMFGVIVFGIVVKFLFFGVGMSFIGSVLTFIVFVLFLLLCYFCMFDDDIDDVEKFINYVILVIGIVCVVFGIVGVFDFVFVVVA